mmetsp:Transcript_88243/g.196258  ORF Transcript_88243/g.196258 Transcript_88243/m.196258 type:complete len:224 (+) Transcript_88243:1490-2161(+)
MDGARDAPQELPAGPCGRHLLLWPPDLLRSHWGASAGQLRQPDRQDLLEEHEAACLGLAPGQHASSAVPGSGELVCSRPSTVQAEHRAGSRGSGQAAEERGEPRGPRRRLWRRHLRQVQVDGLAHWDAGGAQDLAAAGQRCQRHRPGSESRAIRTIVTLQRQEPEASGSTRRRPHTFKPSRPCTRWPRWRVSTSRRQFNFVKRMFNVSDLPADQGSHPEAHGA